MTALYVHAFEHEVKGVGNFNNGDANLHMNQSSAGVAVGYCSERARAWAPSR